MLTRKYELEDKMHNS